MLRSMKTRIDLNDEFQTQFHDGEFHNGIREHIRDIFCKDFYDGSPQCLSIMMTIGYYLGEWWESLYGR